MGRFIKSLVMWTLADAILCGITFAVENVYNGKDIFGNKRPEAKNARRNWNGNIVLGSEDYQVV